MNATETKVKFHKYFVTDGTTRARVHYSPQTNASTGRGMITLYEKNYGSNLPKIFNNVENDTDIMTDYFDDNKVRIREGSPEYAELVVKLKEWGITR